MMVRRLRRPGFNDHRVDHISTFGGHERAMPMAQHSIASNGGDRGVHASTRTRRQVAVVVSRGLGRGCSVTQRRLSGCSQITVSSAGSAESPHGLQVAALRPLSHHAHVWLLRQRSARRGLASCVCVCERPPGSVVIEVEASAPPSR